MYINLQLFRYDPSKLQDMEMLITQVADLGYIAKFVREDRNDSNSAVLKVVIHGMTCSSCVFVIERALRKCKGVTKASVTLSTNR